MAELNLAYDHLKKNAAINSLYISDLFDEGYVEQTVERWGVIAETLTEKLTEWAGDADRSKFTKKRKKAKRDL